MKQRIAYTFFVFSLIGLFSLAAHASEKTESEILNQSIKSESGYHIVEKTGNATYRYDGISFKLSDEGYLSLLGMVEVEYGRYGYSGIYPSEWGKDTPGEIPVPEQLPIDGVYYPVTHIGLYGLGVSDLFCPSVGPITLKLPGTITTIESFATAWGYWSTGNSMLYITLPESVRAIEHHAFIHNTTEVIYDRDFLNNGIEYLGAAFLPWQGEVLPDVPASVKTVQSGAFFLQPKDGKNISHRLVCHATEPPEVVPYIDNEVSLTGFTDDELYEHQSPDPHYHNPYRYGGPSIDHELTVYVPDESVELYKAHPVWGKVKAILPMSTAIDGVENDSDVNENLPVEYFNLQGVRVENPSSGIFIRRHGNKVDKVLLRGE